MTTFTSLSEMRTAFKYARNNRYAVLTDPDGIKRQLRDLPLDVRMTCARSAVLLRQSGPEVIKPAPIRPSELKEYFQRWNLCQRAAARLSQGRPVQVNAHLQLVPDASPLGFKAVRK